MGSIRQPPSGLKLADEFSDKNNDDIDENVEAARKEVLTGFM